MIQQNNENLNKNKDKLLNKIKNSNKIDKILKIDNMQLPTIIIIPKTDIKDNKMFLMEIIRS